MQVFKFPLSSSPNVPTRFGASENMYPLSVQNQDGIPTLWAETDTSAPQVEYLIHAVFTGEQVPENAEYQGTVILGPIVIHYYLEEIE